MKYDFYKDYTKEQLFLMGERTRDTMLELNNRIKNKRLFDNKEYIQNLKNELIWLEIYYNNICMEISIRNVLRLK